ncbi:MAG: heme exporter protein CcmD [Pseudomonadota bacterium]
MPTPSFASFAEFLAMGGHGFYVWLSVALAIIIVLGNLLLLRIARQRFLAAARARIERRAEPDQEGSVVDSAAALLKAGTSS